MHNTYYCLFGSEPLVLISRPSLSEGHYKTESGKNIRDHVTNQRTLDRHFQMSLLQHYA